MTELPATISQYQSKCPSIRHFRAKKAPGRKYHTVQEHRLSWFSKSLSGDNHASRITVCTMLPCIGIR